VSPSLEKQEIDATLFLPSSVRLMPMHSSRSVGIFVYGWNLSTFGGIPRILSAEDSAFSISASARSQPPQDVRPLGENGAPHAVLVPTAIASHRVDGDAPAATKRKDRAPGSVRTDGWFGEQCWLVRLFVCCPAPSSRQTSTRSRGLRLTLFGLHLGELVEGHGGGDGDKGGDRYCTSFEEKVCTTNSL
jgi:hypothetical protein